MADTGLIILEEEFGSDVGGDYWGFYLYSPVCIRVYVVENGTHRWFPGSILTATALVKATDIGGTPWDL